MFDKILIANRGEIACRIARTARRMGIRTVAVYSDADASARHVAACDEAVHIGAPPPRESYLRGEVIIQAALATGAQAIHPGYGFLSENAAFAQAVSTAGLTFIGPPSSAIQAMGSKSAAKALMERAGVPLTPGYHGDEQDVQFLREQAQKIGFPALIKASAGGGGKGMRRVDRVEDFDAALTSCKREAGASFGDDRVLIEKYVLSPRHIEVQVFADSQGDCVYLFERDCSVQRRHQKVIEEAPAPGMTEQRRQQMGEAAVAAAKSVGYQGAGTVEFIAARDGTFYFMEMNTRLQVEHPVTEMITGLDLVEWQIRVASGEPLPLRQEQLTLRGHAFEARVYAEDPARGFLPSIGRLRYLRAPEQTANVRVDTGVTQGDVITAHYDPMIAKLIVWDESRERALQRLCHALEDYRILGVANNVEFLRRIADSPAFASADLDTALIEREHDHLFPAEQAAPQSLWRIAAAAVTLGEATASRAQAGAAIDRYSPWGSTIGWRLDTSAPRSISLRLAESTKIVRIAAQKDAFVLELEGESASLRHWWREGDAFRFDIDGTHVTATVVRHGTLVDVFVNGVHHAFEVVDPRNIVSESTQHAGGLRSPMPGRVVAVLVRAGEQVAKGAPVMVLEAMKMEHTIVAPSAGKIVTIHYAAGDQVAEGAQLAEFEAQS
jgi:3-methylcrotonyl-CoA carboxylase alpha subunit